MRTYDNIKAKNVIEAKEKAIKLNGFGKFPPVCAKNEDGSYRVSFV